MPSVLDAYLNTLRHSPKRLFARKHAYNVFDKVVALNTVCIYVIL